MRLGVLGNHVTMQHGFLCNTAEQHGAEISSLMGRFRSYSSMNTTLYRSAVTLNTGYKDLIQTESAIQLVQALTIITLSDLEHNPAPSDAIPSKDT